MGAATVSAVPLTCGPARSSRQFRSFTFAVSNSTVAAAAVQVNVGRLVPCPHPMISTSVAVPRFDQASAIAMLST